MTSSSPLKGVILIDCAKANIKNGVEVTARQCGYGDDVVAFKAALKSACDDMNIDLQEFAEISIEEGA